MTAKSNHTNDTAGLKAGLIEQIPRLVECLFTGRTIQRTAHEYRIGTQGSISLRLLDGSYFNHESGEGGDILTLIQHSFRTDFKGALVWARGFLGQRADILRPALPHLKQKIDERASRQRDKALSMIKRSTPIERTLGERYLREKRGITMEALPDSIRFLEHGYNYTASGFYPAIIASISDVAGNAIACHCTFLDASMRNAIHLSGLLNYGSSE